MSSYGRKIERLRQTEYGMPVEFAFRLASIGVGALILYTYSGMHAAWLWVGGFYSTHAAYYTFLSSRTERATRQDYFIALALFVSMMISFVWMPAYLLWTDSIAMVFSGTMALICMAIFMMSRADSSRALIMAHVIVACVVVGMACWYFVPFVELPAAQGTMLFAGAVTVGYFGLALLASRRLRLSRTEAALRSAQSQKMEAVGQLAGGIAHDFNNILTAIQGNLELYNSSENQLERDEVVHNAHEASLRAAALVRHLLAYARNVPMEQRRVAVSDILTQLEQLTRRLIPISVALHMIPPEKPLDIEVDPDQLITALVNLIVNARDAMPNTGEVRVRVRTETLLGATTMADLSLVPPGEYAVFSVEDTGSGIPPDMLGRVTEPFFTSKPIGKGSGLGLSMVAGFANQSGGGLRIASSAHGTRAAILLPLPKATAPVGNVR